MTISLTNDGGSGVVNGLDCRASSIMGIRANLGAYKGKYYWEVTKTVQSGYNHVGVVTEFISNGILGGIVYVNSGTGIFSRQNTFSYYYNSTCHKNGVSQGDVDENIGLNDVIGFALDLDNKTVRYYNNGVFQIQIDISDISGFLFYPTASAGNATLIDYRFNFGDSAFYMTPPSGYSAYNTITSETVYKSSLSEMTSIGDVITCEYVGAAGTAGTFSNLGAATKNLIPPETDTAPDGRFDFIKVDKGLLIADRMIHGGVPWSTLNNAGYLQGKIVSLGGQNVRIRSLTGGCAYSTASGDISLTNADEGGYPISNEWDKYVCSSTLNNRIPAGAEIVWNWYSGESIVQDTVIPGITTANYKTTRGKTTSTRISWIVGNSAVNTTGFRPVLEYKEDGSSIW